MRTILLSEADRFISSLPDEDSAKVLAHLKSLEIGKIGGLKIKTLKKKIKELIVASYRIVFFMVGDVMYVTDAFRKKSQRTPAKFIKRAEQILRTINKR